MNAEKLAASLRRIESLVQECLHAVGEESGKPVTKKLATKVLKAEKITLPNLIVELRDSGFFSEPRTAREVQEKLKPKYPCEPDRAAMALKRLMERKQLRKASKDVEGSKQVAYAW
jgi:hypothetical protein